MKKFVLLIASAVLLLTDAYSFDVKLLANNKETISRELSHYDIQQAQDWSRIHRLGGELKKSALKVLTDTFNEMERIDTTCDLGLSKKLEADARKYAVISNEDDLVNFVRWLRLENAIDDILFRLLMNAVSVNQELQTQPGSPNRPFNLNTWQNANVDLEKFYAPTKKWPDDIKTCSLDVYWKMISGLEYVSKKDRDSQILKLNYLAYRNGTIDINMHHKLDVLRRMNALDWPIYFKRYADVINNAKDKLTKTPEVKAENSFATEYVSRRGSLTQRTNLFVSYDSTQVMILARILEKTAKRMDARKASISWQYTDDPNGEGEIYVLSPMEQYRAAIRMLKKDIAEVMRSEGFKNVTIEYDHLIAAAYEAGIIKSAELDQVLKFEDFWNPKIPKWQAYSNFAFSLAGSATIYLPPPWNLIGSIGLILTQTKLVNGDQKPDPDDNWNVII